MASSRARYTWSTRSGADSSLMRWAVTVVSEICIQNTLNRKRNGRHSRLILAARLPIP